MPLNKTTIEALDRMEQQILNKYSYMDCTRIYELMDRLLTSEVDQILAVRDEVVRTLNT